MSAARLASSVAKAARGHCAFDRRDVVAVTKMSRLVQSAALEVELTSEEKRRLEEVYTPRKLVLRWWMRGQCFTRNAVILTLRLLSSAGRGNGTMDFGIRSAKVG